MGKGGCARAGVPLAGARWEQLLGFGSCNYIPVVGRCRAELGSALCAEVGTRNTESGKSGETQSQIWCWISQVSDEDSLLEGITAVQLGLIFPPSVDY